MSQKQRDIISILLEAKLEVAFTEVLRLAKQGFGVAVRSPNPQLRKVFESIARRGVQELAIPVFTDEELSQHPALTSPSILITDCDHPRGLGLIPYALPSLQGCLPNHAAFITIVLRELGLERFMECFTGARVAKVKKLLVKRSLEDVIDIVAEVAFRSGYMGDDEGAESFLGSAIHDGVGIYDREILKLGPAMETFFRTLLAYSPHPHSFLKAALSYYVVRVQGLTMTKASEKFNISRTTLLHHLRLAERLNISQHFSAPINTVGSVEIADIPLIQSLH